MALPTHLQNHMVLAYLSVRDLVEEMELIATRGITRSGTGRRLTPLPPGEWEAMAPGLQDVVARVRAVVEQHAPERLREYETQAATNQTRSWLNIQLGRIEDSLRDLAPERLTRFGQLDPAFTTDLAEGLERARADLQVLRDAQTTKG